MQMDRADNRMVQLKDLLHKGNLKPMTLRDNQEGEGVLRERTLPTRPLLVGRRKGFDPDGLHDQLPPWMNHQAKATLMCKIRRTHTEQNWALPIVIAEQLTATFVNRSTMVNDTRRLVKITLRALPLKYGKPRFDNVKVAVANNDEQTRMYFGRCIDTLCSKCTSTVLLKVILQFIPEQKVRRVFPRQQRGSLHSCQVVQ